MIVSKLNTQAVYSLNEAIIKLHDAAAQADEKTADELRELADEVQFIKGYNAASAIERDSSDWRCFDRDKA